MASENLKSTAITSLDATPPLFSTAGEGASGYLKNISGFLTPSGSANAGSTYQLVRVPTFAKIKTIWFESEAQGAGAFNLSVYYSDSTVDGTPVASQGVIVPTTGDQFFASDIDCSSLVVKTDKTNESTNYNLSLRNKPLWSALGLTTDPGGFFDIVAVCHTTAVTTGGGRLGISVDYVG